MSSNKLIYDELSTDGLSDDESCYDKWLDKEFVVNAKP